VAKNERKRAGVSGKRREKKKKAKASSQRLKKRRARRGGVSQLKREKPAKWQRGAGVKAAAIYEPAGAAKAASWRKSLKNKAAATIRGHLAAAAASAAAKIIMAAKSSSAVAAAAGGVGESGIMAAKWRVISEIWRKKSEKSAKSGESEKCKS
jgi:hypothetical protein